MFVLPLTRLIHLPVRSLESLAWAGTVSATFFLSSLTSLEEGFRTLRLTFDATFSFTPVILMNWLTRAL